MSTPPRPSATTPKQANLGSGNALQRAAAAFWLGHLFWAVRHCPWYPCFTKRFWVEAIWLFSRQLRHTTMTNARRLAGPAPTHAATRRLARQTIASFLQFVLDMGLTQNLAPNEMRQKISRTQGEEYFHQAKARGRGVIIATAHLGSFEIGMAALLPHVTKAHVLFRPDPFANFEALRSDARRRLGVIEHPVDHGLDTWIALRDALAREEIVLIQSDRAEPGQPGIPSPFYDGHIRVPTGPAKLAQLTGAPILPVYCFRDHDGQIVVRITPPIHVGNGHGQLDTTRATHALTQQLQQQIKQHPEQWLMLQPVWIEDQPPTSTTHAHTPHEDAPSR